MKKININSTKIVTKYQKTKTVFSYMLEKTILSTFLVLNYEELSSLDVDFSLFSRLFSVASFFCLFVSFFLFSLPILSSDLELCSSSSG